MINVLRIAKRNVPSCHTKTKSGCGISEIVCSDLNCTVRRSCGFRSQHLVIQSNEIQS